MQYYNPNNNRLIELQNQYNYWESKYYNLYQRMERGLLSQKQLYDYELRLDNYGSHMSKLQAQIEQMSTEEREQYNQYLFKGLKWYCVSLISIVLVVLVLVLSNVA